MSAGSGNNLNYIHSVPSLMQSYNIAFYKSTLLIIFGLCTLRTNLEKHILIQKSNEYLISIGINGDEKRDNFSNERILFARGTLSLQVVVNLNKNEMKSLSNDLKNT